MEDKGGLALVALYHLVVEVVVIHLLEHLRLPLGQTGPHGKFSLGEIDGLVVVHISCSSILFIFKDHCFTSCAEISRIFHKISKAAPGRSRIEPHLVLGEQGKVPMLGRPFQIADLPRHHPAWRQFISTFGAVHQSHSSPQKQKRLCLSKETKANKPLRYHSSCRKGIPSQPLKCCPVTEASEGAYLSSAPLLQGDLSRLLPSALHQTAALFAGGMPVTRPFPRRNVPFTGLSYHIFAVCQGGFCKRYPF